MRAAAEAANRRSASRERARLFYAGGTRGTAGVLMQHVARQGAWNVQRVATLLDVCDLLDDTEPEAIVAVWTGEIETKTGVAVIRGHPRGRNVPVILIGSPAGDGPPVPSTPVKGVLCLPRSLGWRTFLLCLGELLKAAHRRAATEPLTP